MNGIKIYFITNICIIKGKIILEYLNNPKKKTIIDLKKI